MAEPRVAPSREERLARLADARLYLCSGAARDDLPAYLDAVLGAGVDVVQLRDKGLEAADELAVAPVFAAAAARHGRLWSVNDRADVAYAAAPDVLHLGQRDLPVPVARALVGPDLLVGRSTHTPAEVEAAAVEPGVDYFCVGPVWVTPTKPGRTAAGPALVAHAARVAPPDDPASRPWFAIGGVGPGTLDAVLAAGARRVVVVRAVTDAADPAAAVRELVGRLRS